jgi:ankyrin repeat protein
MMGELPLSVAALTFNTDMVDTLVSHGAKLHAVNSRGDTALHSLVRFAALHPEKEAEVVAMMRELHTRLHTPAASPAPQVNTHR